MSTVNALKSQAKRLRTHLANQNIQLSHSQVLEAIAACHGHKDWNTAFALLNANPLPESGTGSTKSANCVTICITFDMTIDDVREQVELHLRNHPEMIRLRVDAGASLGQHREAYEISREIVAKGVLAEVDSALDY
jgi:hypothetical protein